MQKLPIKPIKHFKINGFTLIELLVSVSIIGILSSLLFANIHLYGRTGGLNIAAQKLISDIRMVQGYALGLKDFNGLPPEGGWGVRFIEEANDYTIFADYKGGGTKVWGMYDDEEEQSSILEIIKGGVNIQGGIDVDGTTYQFAYLVFEPPDPIVHINASNVNSSLDKEDGDIMTIILELSGTTLTKKITINKFGLVDVED